LEERKQALINWAANLESLVDRMQNSRAAQSASVTQRTKPADEEPWTGYRIGICYHATLRRVTMMAQSLTDGGMIILPSRLAQMSNFHWLRHQAIWGIQTPSPTPSELQYLVKELGSPT
jgi:hypothetical protein